MVQNKHKVSDSLKQSIYNSIKKDAPLHAAMFLKNWKRYKMSAELFMNLPDVNTNNTILDFGCGVPFVVKILTEHGYKITGFEPYANEKEMKVVSLLGLENNYISKLESGRLYDNVLMIDVIEHLAVITPVMENIYALLGPSGILFISTPNVLRFDMWKKFVFRKTGHPTNIDKYLNATDHFKNHQREFTMEELILTCKHFKFGEILLRFYGDTQPSNAQLNEYHKLLEDGLTFKPSLKEKLQNLILILFPPSFKNNNLFVAARKK